VVRGQGTQSTNRTGVILLTFALAVLAISSGAYFVSGGFEVEVFGIRLKLHSLDRPLFISFSLLTIWVLVFPDSAMRAIAWIEDQSERRASALIWGLAATAATAMSALKITQHRLLQTTAFDLGIQGSVAWNTAHGRPFWDSIQGINYLGDHFSPIHAVLSFTVGPSGSAVPLLILQSVGFGVAAIAVYRMSVRHLENRSLGFLASVLFLCNPYLHSISRFDFHPAALAVPIFL
jgi:hypothetical protein